MRWAVLDVFPEWWWAAWSEYLPRLGPLLRWLPEADLPEDL